MATTTHGISSEDKQHDIAILNRALFFENRAVWVYRAAPTKLSSNDVGRAVLALASENQPDHEKHQDLLRNAITLFGGTPTPMENSYDLSSYINKGYGNLDNDVNIAKLALDLEVGAAAGYVTDTTQLKSPAMIDLEAGIACVEAIHAARIRAAFNELGIKLPVVPNPVLNAASRHDWVLKV
jgi:ferritin-like protein